MRVLILGAGGHAQVVADILLRMRETGAGVAPLGYLDDNPALVGQHLFDIALASPKILESVVSHYLRGAA